ILVGAEEDTIAQRRKLQWSGIVTVALAVSDKGEIVSDPDVKAAGLPSTLQNGDDMVDFIAETALEILEGLSKPKRRDPDVIEGAIARGVRSALNGVWGKKPVCHVIVLVV
ncbi:MAG: MBL fold metallo-hydrolase, partial [Hyphomicrobiales bacterium]